MIKYYSTIFLKACWSAQKIPHEILKYSPYWVVASFPIMCLPNYYWQCLFWTCSNKYFYNGRCLSFWRLSFKNITAVSWRLPPLKNYYFLIDYFLTDWLFLAHEKVMFCYWNIHFFIFPIISSVSKVAASWWVFKYEIEYIFEYMFCMTKCLDLKLGELIDIVMVNIFSKTFVWFKGLGPKFRSFFN